MYGRMAGKSMWRALLIGLLAVRERFHRNDRNIELFEVLLHDVAHLVGIDRAGGIDDSVKFRGVQQVVDTILAALVRDVGFKIRERRKDHHIIIECIRLVDDPVEQLMLIALVDDTAHQNCKPFASCHVHALLPEMPVGTEYDSPYIIADLLSICNEDFMNK